MVTAIVLLKAEIHRIPEVAEAIAQRGRPLGVDGEHLAGPAAGR